MPLNLGAGFGAGAGASTLQDILAQAFKEQLERKRAAQEDQRIGIERQRANSDDELRRIALEDRQTAQEASRHAGAVTSAGKIAGTLRIKQDLSPDAAATLRAGDMGDTIKAPTLSSRNIGQGMTSTPNPGRGETYLGTAGQQEDQAQKDEFTRSTEMTADPVMRGKLRMLATMVPDMDKRGPAAVELLKEQAKPAEHSPAYKEWQDAVASGYKGDFNAYQNEDANRKRPTINIHTGEKSADAAKAAAREQNEVQDSLGLIDQIRKDPALASSTGPVEGRGAGYLTAGPEGFTRVKALHDNLVNKLQLAQAGKLKGQGQISNMEREMLKNAATALDMKLGDADYLNELAKVEAQFKRMLTTAPAPAAIGGAATKPSALDLIKKYGGG